MRLFVWFLLISIVSNSAGAADVDAPKIIDATIGNEYLHLTFDKPMQSWSERGRIVNIETVPAVPCDWRWDEDASLSCTVNDESKEFLPANYYQVIVGKGLYSQEGLELVPTTLKLSTEAPKIFADLSGWREGQPSLEIKSHQPVTADAIRDVLTVTLDSKSIPFQLVKKDREDNYGPVAWYTLLFNGGNARNAVLAIKVKPGMKSPLGPILGVQNEELLQARINEPLHLRSIRCTNGSEVTTRVLPQEKQEPLQCNPLDEIVLSFSSTLDANSLAAIQKSLPTGFTIKPSDKSYYWYYDQKLGEVRTSPSAAYVMTSNAAASKYLLELPQNLESVEGKQLVKTEPVLISIGDFKESMVFTPKVQTLAPNEEGETRLSVMNSSMTAVTLGQFEIGRTVRIKSKKIKIKSQRNNLLAITMSAADAKIKNKGGLVLSGLKEKRDLGYGIAYVPFNVMSYQSVDRKHALVWATEWQSGLPVANAEVEILRVDFSRKVHQLSRAKTDASGVATLSMPGARPTGTDFTTLVRVISGEEVVVSPAFAEQNSRLAFDIDRPWAYGGRNQYRRVSEGNVTGFGVTELPLYRPGESVNFRLWVRQKTGNHLSIVPNRKKISLQLAGGIFEKKLQEWEATLDENGSVSGQLQLSKLLTDGFYCIAENDDEEEYASDLKGACFHVARFEPQPLWVSLKADHPNILLGQELKFQLESGFFSGGPAANVGLRFRGLNTVRRIEDAYPDFASFTFINPFKDDGSIDAGSPVGKLSLPKNANAQGKTEFTVSFKAPLRDQEGEHDIPFGVMQFSAEAYIPGKASASSGSLSVNYSQYPSFVGLKTKNWRIGNNQDIELEAAVVTYDGKAVNGEEVSVEIFQILGDDKELHAGKCKIISGKMQACAFRAKTDGLYRFTAGSKGSASTEISRYIGEPPQQKASEEKPSAAISLLQASNGKTNARVLLDQPFEKATVLFTLEYSSIVHYWVQHVDKKQLEIDIPVKAEWAPGLSLHAIVRPAGNQSVEAAENISTLSAFIDLNIPKFDVETLTVNSNKSGYKPGDEVELTIVNKTNTQRSTTISVIDDSIYQQAADIWDYQDPNAGHWLGSLNTWYPGDWYGLEAWRSIGNLFYESDSMKSLVSGARIQQVNKEMAQPVQVVSREENGKELDSVNVVGSRIRAVDAYYAAPVANVNMAKRRGISGKPMPRVRSQFQDSAYWNPDILLAAGESKTIKFKLPDNLTQWRVLMWASDSGDGFAQIQSTFETSLPIEVRAGLPSQLFVGDQSVAQISARNQSEKAVVINLSSALTGAGVSLEKSDKASVNPYTLLEQELGFSPTKAGDLDVLSIADSAEETDGLSSGTVVKSRYGEEKIPQSGWLDLNQLNLMIPKLPASAIEARLDLQVNRGFHAWTDGWLKDLQDYPHRCWEQTLSRAVGGAYAEAYDKESLWSDRIATVNDALQVASSFKDDSGYYRYFQSETFEWNQKENLVLSAYTLKSFRYLQKMGYPVSRHLMDELEENLPDQLINGVKLEADGEPAYSWETSATIAGVIENPEQLDVKVLESLWSHWDKLSWFGRGELLRAMARKTEFTEQTGIGIQRLREAGVKNGARQVINETRDFSYYMGSDLRDQCAVVSTLFKLDKSVEGRSARERLLRGVYDLYAGGTASMDTQSSAQCLMALHDVINQNNAVNADTKITVALDANSQILEMPVDKREVNLQSPLARTSKTLSLAADKNAGGTMNYSAVISYQYDLQQAEARGVGLNVQRHYDVLQNGKWVPLPKTGLREGDWVRIRLEVTAPKERHFVAVSDFVPGGLVTRDITLSSVGGADLKNIGDNGSYYFDSRQTGVNVVRIYAEYLPAGRHEIYYYAQAVNPGDYFAPPAVAELMYGRASRANTSADRVTVQASQ